LNAIKQRETPKCFLIVWVPHLEEKIQFPKDKNHVELELKTDDL